MNNDYFASSVTYWDYIRTHLSRNESLIPNRYT